MKIAYRRKHIAAASFLAVSTMMFAFAFLREPAAEALKQQQSAAALDALQQSWRLLEHARDYRFTADVEQIFIPRAVSSNIGKRDTRLDLRMDGEVRSRNDMTLRLRAESAKNQVEPVTIERRDGVSFVITPNGERRSVEDPLGAVALGDSLGYLAGAKNVRIDAADVDGIVRYAFDIDGDLMADYAQRELNGAFNGTRLASYSSSALLRATNGSGELWVSDGGRGAPVRQVIDVRVREVSEQHDARLHMQVDFSGVTTPGVAAPERALFALRRWVERMPDARSLALLMCLTLAASIMIALYRRHPRGARRGLSVGLALMMALPSPLQALAQSTVFAASPPASLLETLGLVSAPAKRERARSALRTAIAQAATNTGASCGDAIDGADSDGDGLSDLIESCYGTDAFVADSDFDGLSDGAEVQTVTLGGQTFAGDPQHPDANRDGLIDLAEYPPVRGGGALTPTVPGRDASDFDGDNAPNWWDDDNDNDGVLDGIDLSPFAAEPLAQSFELSINPNGYTGTTFVEFQIQPENLEHLRYTTSALDWPSDDAGAIQDLDDSTEDLRLIPVVRARVNIAPSTELASRYGVIVQSDGDGYLIFAPVQPVGDGGAIRAFMGRVAYAALGDTLNWTDAELLWMVQVRNDSYVNCGVEDAAETCQIDTDASVIQTYGEQLRLTGLNITKSQDFEAMLIGTPTQPSEDRYLFQAMFGMHRTFMQYAGMPDQGAGNTVLRKLDLDFNGVNTAEALRFGVPHSVTLATSRGAYAHMDEGSAGIGERLAQFLTTNYPESRYNATNRCQRGSAAPADCATVLIATEQRIGAADMTTLRSSASGPFVANFAQIPMSTKRGMRLVMSERAPSGWRSVDNDKALSVIEARYADQLETIREQSNDPDVTNDTISAALIATYASWLSGQMMTVSIDGLVLVPTESPNTEDLVDAINGLASTTTLLPNYLVEFSEFKTELAGTKLKDATRAQKLQFAAGVSKIAVGLANITLSAFRIACADNEDYAGCDEDALERAEIAGYVLGTMAAIGAAHDLFEVVKAFKAGESALKLTGTATQRAGGVMAIVGTIIGVTLVWVSFGVNFGSLNDSPVTLNNAIALAVVTTIYLIVLLAISFTGVGAIISAVFGVIDAILMAATGGDWSVARVFTELFYSAKMLTELDTTSFEGLSTSSQPAPGADDGIIAGNTFQVRDTFTGILIASGSSLAADGGDEDDLNDSYAEAAMEGSSDDTTVAQQNSERACTLTTSGEDDAISCSNTVGVDFGLLTPGINQVVSILSVTEYQYAWKECGAYGGICGSRKLSVVTTPEEDEDREDATMDIEIDVLPNTLSGLWSWSELANPDRDGDGVTNLDEGTFGTNIDLWDSDADGLSDKYEIDNASQRGTDPNLADSDSDGLSDAYEVRYGLRVNDADSDDDGLLDGTEIFHATPSTPVRAALASESALGARAMAAANDVWVGGWPVRLPGGITRMTFSPAPEFNTEQDNLLDSQEQANGVSPFAVNEAPRLRISARPFAIDPATGKSGVYVAPDTAVSATISLGSFGPYAITNTLRVCVPSLLVNPATGVVQGDRAPVASIGVCDSGTRYSYAFSGADTLQIAERISATFSARTSASGASASGSFNAAMPYADQILSATVPIVIDADDPRVALIAPLDGAVLRGDSYVVGGRATDPSSWIDAVGVTVNGSPIAALNAGSDSLAPFAVTWALPADGVYELRASARDHVGRSAQSGIARVTVDNTAPQAAYTGPNAIRPAANGMTVTLSGTSSDNLSGIARIQLSIDKKPWREVFVASAAFPLSQNWQFAWVLPGVEAQGAHAIHVRAFDRAGNISAEDRKTIVVDLLAPTDNLLSTRFQYAPQVRAGEAITLAGKANDLGRAALTVRPEPLVNTLSSVLSATVWLQPGLLGDDDAGVQLTWLGDINGDGRADLAIGLPGARGGAGMLSIVHGRGGNWTRTDLAAFKNVESLDHSRSVFVGAPAAQLGRHIAASGDLNGDGLDDFLVGDPANRRAFLIFGQTAAYGGNLVLAAPLGGRRIVFEASGDANFGARVSALGDINGDGFNDFAVGGDARAYVLLGHNGAWLSTQSAPSEAAGVITLDSAAATVTGVGDLNGDELDEFVVTRANEVRVHAGATFYAVRGGAVISNGAALALPSADAAPRISALGDVNGDGRADFVYSDANAPQLVLGAANGAHTRRALNYAPAANGLLAAPGDVNADGRMDIVLGNALGDAFLIYGTTNIATVLPNIAATFSAVSGVASTPFAAGADVNCDASSDVLLVPSPASGGGLAALTARTSSAPNVPLADRPTSALPVARPAPPAEPAGILVDDDGGAAHTSIQAAITAAPAGATIVVRPGVYAPFTITNKNDLSIIGVDPDAVFIDGGGAGIGISVSNANGVQLRALTVRNVDVGIDLNGAGVNGYLTPTLRTRIERVVVHSFDDNGLRMNRTSSALLERNTFAGKVASGDYITVTETPDAALVPTWSSIAVAPWAIGAGGGIFAESNRVFALQGDGNTGLAEYLPGGNTWAARAAAPQTFGAGQSAAAGGDGALYATMPSSWQTYGGTAVASTRQQVATADGTLFRILSDSTLQRFDGSTWSTIAEAQPGGGHSNAKLWQLMAVGNEIFVAGAFASFNFPLNMTVWNDTALVSQNFFNVSQIARFNSSTQIWRPGTSGSTFEITAMTNFGNALFYASQEGNIYSGTLPTGNAGASTVAIGNVSACIESGGCAEVRALHSDGASLYVGGYFDGARQQGSSTVIPSGNIIKLNLAVSPPTIDTLGGGVNSPTLQKAVHAIEMHGGALYAGGEFTQIGGVAVSKAARYDGATWSTLGTLAATGVTPIVRTMATLNGYLFIGGAFDTAGGVASPNLVIWDALAGTFVSALGGVGATGGATRQQVVQLDPDPVTGSLLVGGYFLTVGGSIATGSAARLQLPALRSYTLSTNAWSAALSSLPFNPSTVALAMTSDGAGNLYLATVIGSGIELWRYTTATATWTPRAPVGVVSANTRLALTHVAGNLYLIRSDGQTQLWRYSIAGDNWLARANAPINFGPGASLVWDGGAYLYANNGGGGVGIARYDIASNLWQSDANAAASFNDGGGLTRVATTVYAVRGGNQAGALKYMPVNTPPAVKLNINNTLFVAPVGDAAATVHHAGISRPDFSVAHLNNHLVSNGTVWATPVAMTTHTHAAARLLDPARNVYRLELGGTLGTPATAGYHNGGGDVYVSPAYCPTCANDGLIWNSAAFDSIQAALNSGALRVRVRPGIYREHLRVPSGVSIIGSGGDQTLIEAPTGPTTGATAVATFEGVASSALARATVSGADLGMTAVRIDGGALHVRIARAIVSDALVGVSVDGAATKSEVANVTAVGNVTGFAAVNCADMNIRNSIFAGNTFVGISYVGCAASNLERYNLFYQNGANGFADIALAGGSGPQAASGIGDLGADPLFVNAAAGDYRLSADSPAINAGDPGDPTPPGTGGRVDIGYLQQGQASVYADDSYCAQCLNDGLDWQVDAFNRIQPALDAAAAEIRGMRFTSQTYPSDLRLVVGIGPGAYTETLTLPSYVSLVGVGADQVLIGNATAAPTALISDVVSSEINGVTLRGAAGTPGIRIGGRASGISVTHTILRGFDTALEVRDNASAVATFNTVVANAIGIRGVSNPGWLVARNNILASNGVALQGASVTALIVNNNLMHANTTAYSGISAGANDINGDPLFVAAASHNYRLQVASPAIDRATRDVIAPLGGGERADLGVFETLAAPVSLFFGKEGVSCEIGNSGVARVEVALVGPINAAQLLTQSVPAAWNNAALVTPLAPASYWTAVVNAPGNGLYRIYTRATDGLNNIETEPQDWYAGALQADALAPVVSWITPTADISSMAAAVELVGEIAAFNGDETAQEVSFEITNGGVTQVLAGAWVSPVYTPGQPRRFRTMAPLAIGAHNIVVLGRDTAGNVGRSAARTVTISAPVAVLSLATKLAAPARVNRNQLGGTNDNAVFTAPLNDQWVNTTTVAVEGFARFGATGGLPQIVLRVDGGAQLTVTLADYKDAAIGTPMPWDGVLTVPASGSHTLSARAVYGIVAGQTTSITVRVDMISPTLGVAASSGYVTSSVRLTGTVSDAQSGVAGVDVSFDGGFLWLPAQVAGGAWSIVHALPDAREAESYPIYVRARDVAGNLSTQRVTATVDTEAPAGIDPVAFNIAPGSHLDSIQTLVMTWTAPLDGSGIAAVRAAIDQVSTTLPSTTAAGVQYSAPLNLDGAWYSHLSATDNAGNTRLSHYGPWYVSTGLLCAAPQSIQFDGLLDLSHNEWRPAEFLDDDERPMLDLGGARQSLYATWDSTAFYLGWRGGAWAVDGAMWAYLDLDGVAGGSLAPVVALTPTITLPFQADLAIMISAPSVGTLYRFVAGSWQEQGALQFNHANADSEVRVPLALSAISNLKLAAYAAADNGRVTSAFPTTNALAPAGGAWQTSYAWANPCALTQPNDGQPRVDTLALRLNAREAPNAFVGPNGTIHYTVTLENLEARSVTPAQIVLATTSGATLDVSSLTPGALAPGAIYSGTVNAALAADLIGLRLVTTTAQLGANNAALTHRVDGDAPIVAIIPLPGGLLGPVASAITGSADDGLGSGVQRVDVSIDSGPWIAAEGVANWSQVITLTGAQVNVRAQAIDGVGLRSAIVERTITVDNQPPSVQQTLPAVVTGSTTIVNGTASDAPTGGLVARVDVQIDDEGALWDPASNLAEQGGGAQGWNFAWQLPALDGQLRRMRARAMDAAGNISVGEWQTTTVDTLGPLLTSTHATIRTTQPIVDDLLRGVVTDGGGVRGMRVIVYAPDGASYAEVITQTSGAWAWRPAGLPMRGVYAVRVEATDAAGNVSVLGPFALGVDADPPVTATPGSNVTPQPTATAAPSVGRNIFLPVVNRESSGSTMIGPDLVITALTSVPSGAINSSQRVVISVTVRNAGNAPTSGFWVELMVNPKRAPGVNDTWNTLCDPPWPNANCFGGSWFVNQTLAPGASLTLTSESLLVDTQYSHWTGTLGAPGIKTIYAYADSYNAGGQHGLIAETNEANNGIAPITVNVSGAAEAGQASEMLPVLQQR